MFSPPTSSSSARHGTQNEIMGNHLEKLSLFTWQTNEDDDGGDAGISLGISLPPSSSQCALFRSNPLNKTDGG